MINDILDFSMISDGKLNINGQHLNVYALVKEAVKLIEIQAKMKGIQILIQKEIRNEIINTDRKRLWHVLLDLLGNAIKFTDSDAKTIRVKEEIVATLIPEVISVKNRVTLIKKYFIS